MRRSLCEDCQLDAQAVTQMGRYKSREGFREIGILCKYRLAYTSSPNGIKPISLHQEENLAETLVIIKYCGATQVPVIK